MTEFFDKLSSIKLGDLSLGTLLSALIIFIVCYIAIRILNKAAGKLIGKSRMEASLKSFLTSAVKAVLWIIAALIIADSLGIPVTSLVALISVVGLALSLSIQGLLGNLFSGITLLVTKPFVVGDYVELGSCAGTVRSIGLFYTTESVFAALIEAAQSDDRVLKDPAPFVGISAYNASDVQYALRVWCKSADYWSVHFALNELVRQSFERHGVIMSYEHLEVHISEK